MIRKSLAEVRATFDHPKSKNRSCASKIERQPNQTRPSPVDASPRCTELHREKGRSGFMLSYWGTCAKIEIATASLALARPLPPPPAVVIERRRRPTGTPESASPMRWHGEDDQDAMPVEVRSAMRVGHASQIANPASRTSFTGEFHGSFGGCLTSCSFSDSEDGKAQIAQLIPVRQRLFCTAMWRSTRPSVNYVQIPTRIGSQITFVAGSGHPRNVRNAIAGRGFTAAMICRIREEPINQPRRYIVVVSCTWVELPELTTIGHIELPRREPRALQAQSVGFQSTTIDSAVNTPPHS